MRKYLSLPVNVQSTIKFFKFISLFFVLTMGVATFISCGSSGDQDDNAINADTSSGGAPTNVVLYDPKSLFIYSSSQSAAAYRLDSIESLQVASELISGEDALYQITQDGEVLEVVFLDENGDELEVRGCN